MQKLPAAVPTKQACAGQRHSLSRYLPVIALVLSLAWLTWPVQAQAGVVRSPAANLAPSSAAELAAAPEWNYTGSMGAARRHHSATLLQNGLVLVAGGNIGFGADDILDSAELYDPATGKWRPTGSMATKRSDHSATLLPNGLVLVAGGTTGGGILKGAELYDPATETWSSAAGNMTKARWAHSATLLHDGTVLIVGGDQPTGDEAPTAELYDPAPGGGWSAAGNLTGERFWHTATLLPDKRVLVAGGFLSVVSTATAELYDPTTRTWIATDEMEFARHYHTSTLLPDGKVLVAGGSTGFSDLNSVELYDPLTDKWSTAGSGLVVGRSWHSATLLPNGKVFITGGANSTNSVELYSPDAESSATGSLKTARSTHTVTLLPKGQVLVAGGYNGSYLNSAELYDPAPVTEKWTTTTDFMSGDRRAHSATLLPNGRVLVTGGATGVGPNPGYLKSTDLYDPDTQMWNAATTMSASRAYHSATLLTNGKVLVAGGYNGNWLSAAELYDPATGQWTTTGSLKTARSDHSATLLADGQVLVVGGEGPGDYLDSAELYDPVTGKWSATKNSLASERGWHTATLLPDGKVLVAGGFNGAYLTGSELYDPATGMWSDADDLVTKRSDHTATLLPSGKVLVVGGGNNLDHVASAEVYNPATDTWSGTGSLANKRRQHSATLLRNGQVLVAGGHNGSYLADAELYDPATGKWRAAASLNYRRRLHSATLLPNGQVLAAAGQDTDGSSHFEAELYDIGKGYLPAWQPGLNTITSPVAKGETLVADGSGWRGHGYTAASSGGPRNSATNYPLVQIQRLDSGQTLWLPSSTFTETALTSVPLSDFPRGHALATIFVNGIPSEAKIVLSTAKHTVTPSAGPNGNIAPNVPESVYEWGNSSQYTITPAANYHVADVTVNGSSKGPIGNIGLLGVFTDTLIHASFAIDRYALSLNTTGNGSGSVSSAPSGIACGDDCSEEYDHGTTVILTASPDTNSTFSGWIGDCNSNGEVTITAAKKCTANFTIKQHRLSVTRAGSGSGSVSSIPAGIACGDDCEEEYDHGTAVTLTAQPDAGSTFSGWSEGCDKVTTDAAKSCTATFIATSTGDDQQIFLPLINR